MQKTQLTVLIEFISEQEKIEGWDATMEVIKNKAIDLLPKEREDMEKAFDDGHNQKWGDGKAVQIYEHEYIDATGGSLHEEYFIEKYLQYKP